MANERGTMQCLGKGAYPAYVCPFTLTARTDGSNFGKVRRNLCFVSITSSLNPLDTMQTTCSHLSDPDLYTKEGPPSNQALSLPDQPVTYFDQIITQQRLTWNYPDLTRLAFDSFQCRER